MQKRKNIKLLVFLVLIISANVALIFFEPQSDSGFNDPYLFTLKDTTGIDLIQFKKEGAVMKIEKVDNKWRVNENYAADPRMIGLFFAVMTSVEVNREFSKTGTAEENNLPGAQVSIAQGSNEVLSFVASGNSTKTNSYFTSISNEKSYVVSIPGYTSFVSGIFDLTESDWRNKQVFNTSWSSLKSLRLESNNSKAPQLAVNYLNNFFRIDGVKQVDTVIMMDYLEQTTTLQVSQFLSEGEYAEYDSLAKESAAYILTVEDVSETHNGHIEIFPLLPGDQRRLIKIFPSEQLAIVQERAMQNVIKSAGDFRLKK